MTHTQKTIVRLIGETPDVAPRLIETVMRLRHDTLDHLSEEVFKKEATVSVGVVRENRELVEAAATQVFGL